MDYNPDEALAEIREAQRRYDTAEDPDNGTTTGRATSSAPKPTMQAWSSPATCRHLTSGLTTEGHCPARGSRRGRQHPTNTPLT